MAENEVYPLNLLTEELKSDDTETRIKTMRRIKTVAQALGPDRTRTELLPFLNESTEDEDEILVTLSEELGGFIDLVGGPSQASCLLEPLESLAAVEETVVRDKAIASIKKVVDVMTDVTDTMVPMIKRLAGGDWFTSRVSSCGLFAVTYPKVSDANAKKELRDLFQTLSGDDTPMVRRAAASNIGPFAANIEKEFLVSAFVDLFKTLSGDDQDSVRLLAIESCGTMAKLLSEEESKQHILPLVSSSIEDRSWRVRNSIAKDFSRISQAMGVEITKSVLLAGFVSLLQDAEAEVRSAASKNISSYVDIVGIDLFVSEVLPHLHVLSQDSAPNVRGSVSIAVMELAPKLGKERMKESLLQLYQVFLRDEVVDVRLNILRRISMLAEWAPAIESSLIPEISNLARDLQWRVREAVIQTLPDLAASMGTDYFRDNMLSMYLDSFTDMVGQVREASTSILADLLGAVGSDWIVQHIMPKLTEIFDKSQIYQERVNVLHAVKCLACDKASAPLLNELTQLALRGARDKIPNVRFAASQTLEAISRYTEPSIVASQLRPCLAELQNDTDSDVKYFASAALEAAS